jgi:hypothetical protein
MKCLHKDTKYLDNPLFTSPKKTKDFNFLQEKLESRLKGWRIKCLSWASRSTMIKLVAQALQPSHFQHVMFQLKCVIVWMLPLEDFGGILKKWQDVTWLGNLGIIYANQEAREGWVSGYSKDSIGSTSKMTWMILSKRNSICMNALRRKYWLRCELVKKCINYLVCNRKGEEVDG